MTTRSGVAVVFGGSRGIGAACADKLKERGWDVAVTYTNQPPRDANHRAYQADVRKLDEIAAVFDRVERDLGTPTAVVANAGINMPADPVTAFNAEDFRQLVEVNIVGAFNMLSEAGRRVVDGGAIVAVTTSLVRHAVAGSGPYTASKAAVESLARSMAKELAGRGIRVNCIAPGPVDTELFHSFKTEEAKLRMASLSPFGRIGRADEIAEVVTFLLSQKSSWIHGQIIQANGGMV